MKQLKTFAFAGAMILVLVVVGTTFACSPAPDTDETEMAEPAATEPPAPEPAPMESPAAGNTVKNTNAETLTMCADEACSANCSEAISEGQTTPLTVPEGSTAYICIDGSSPNNCPVTTTDGAYCVTASEYGIVCGLC